MTRSSARPRTVIRSFAVSFLTLLCLGLVAPAAGAATGDVTEFAIPTPASLPQGIVIGPDGVSWFAQRSANAIGSLSNGTFSQYPLPNAGSAPFWVALGSDGNVVQASTGNRREITSTGEITEYLIPTAGSQPGGITAGPDGALWFTEQTGNRIGRITTAGQITEFALPRASSGPLGITAGPDGALWFTEAGTAGNRIGKITTVGSVTEYAFVFSNRQPTDITVGGDGSLWFTERAGNAVGRITPGGKDVVLPLLTLNPVGSPPAGRHVVRGVRQRQTRASHRMDIAEPPPPTELVTFGRPASMGDVVH
jgi:virginiamycin B lyase